MTRTRTSIIPTTALVSLLGAALPAFAQAPAPAPMYAPPQAPMYAPPQAPMYAPPQAPMMAPAPEAAVMPVAPMMAPRAPDDMTGSVGFGVGVGAGTSLIVPYTNIMMKYWMSDAMALMPSLTLGVRKVKDSDAAWSFSPALLAKFGLLKGASTRLDIGAGLGINLSKWATPAATATNPNPDPVAPADTTVGIFVPVELGVEHFFTRWFSMGLGAQFHLIDFSKIGEGWKAGFEVSNTKYMGSLFFYTD